jgi:hypothetical protein
MDILLVHLLGSRVVLPTDALPRADKVAYHPQARVVSSLRLRLRTPATHLSASTPELDQKEARAGCCAGKTVCHRKGLPLPAAGVMARRLMKKKIRDEHDPDAANITVQ